MVAVPRQLLYMGDFWTVYVRRSFHLCCYADVKIISSAFHPSTLCELFLFHSSGICLLLPDTVSSSRSPPLELYTSCSMTWQASQSFRLHLKQILTQSHHYVSIRSKAPAQKWKTTFILQSQPFFLPPCYIIVQSSKQNSSHLYQIR